MKELNKDKIMQHLQSHYDHIKQFYNEDNILGIFLYGSQNYGFATDESDVDAKAIIVPDFQDLVLRYHNLESKDYEVEGEHIDVKDIRVIVQNFKKQNINFIELLFTEYCIINPKYEALFQKYFIDNRELIAHYDEKKAVMSITHQAIHTIEQGKEDKKKLHNGARLYQFLKRYLKGKPYQTCITLSDNEEMREWLWDIKFDEETLTPDGRRRECEYIIQRLNQTIAEWELETSEPNSELDELMNQGVLEIVQCGLQKTQTYMTKDEFIQNLTHAEEAALTSIMETIENEGNVTISKLVKDYVISRPVYNNLLLKLQKYDIATVVNMGAKGTYISFTNPLFRR